VTIALGDLIANPKDVAVTLRSQIYGLLSAVVEVEQSHFVVLHLTLHPWQGPAAEGYPIERIRLAAWSHGLIAAIPEPRDTRLWLHRFPDLLRQLCLWDPWDPPGLRWNELDGIETYVHIVHRHLQAEENWRRSGRWPVEDSPHGDGAHPILTPLMEGAGEGSQR